MDFGIYAGDTDKTIYLRLRDSTTGLAKTGLAFNSAGAVASYVLPLAARAAITLATQTVTGAHSDGGFVEVDATNCKGLYRLDLPDAAIASGNFTLISIEFDGIIEESVLIPLHVSKANVTQWLGTAAATPTVAGVPEVDVTHYAGSTTDVSTIPASVAAILVDTGTTLDARIPAALVSGRMDSSVGAMAANVLTAAATAADFTTEIQTGLATGADLATVAGYLDTEIAAILADTNELQTDWANGGRLDLILDARASQTSVDDLPTNAELATALGTADDAVLAAIAALNNLSAAQVNAEVVDALATDTYAEPGQGSPGATIALSAKIGYLYKAWRNRTTQTATEYALYADNATTKDHEAVVSDDGATFERGEISTGA